MMSETQFYDVLRKGLWTAVEMSAPLLGVALVAGLAIGLVQALTSVQEMTLTFVPKLVAIMAVFWITMGAMWASVDTYFQATVLPLVGMP